jgi:hypothetical protein
MISYTTGGGGLSALRFIHCNDANCDPLVNGPESDELIDAVGFNGSGIGGTTTLRLDAAGNPVIAYTNNFNDGRKDIKLAHCNDVNCAGGDDANNPAVPVIISVALSPSMVLDANGRPVITYGGVGANQFVVHCNDPACAGGDETAVTIDGKTAGNNGSSIAMDASGFPVVAFPDSNQGSPDLRIVHCGDANCSVPAIPTSTPTATVTNTPLPPTATAVAATNTPQATPTPSNTPVPPTVTNTPVPPTATNTSTNTPVPPTATHTSTNTPVPPTATHTATNTPAPPTATHTATNTPLPPTATHTATTTPVPPTATHTATNTPAPPTVTNTPVPTHTPTNTPAPPSPTSSPTNTSVPPTATATPIGPKCADVNGDGRVNSIDMVRIFIQMFRPYNATYDITQDGAVNISDLFAAAMQFNRRCRQ